MIDYELLVRISERYTPEEFVELLGVTVEELVDAFENKIVDNEEFLEEFQ